MSAKRPTYTLLDELTASPTDPMPAISRDATMARMLSALASIERGSDPQPDDWRLCSDAVNMFETLVEMGVCQDGSGLLQDAVAALAMAGKRAMAGKGIRLDGAGIATMRAVLEDYAEIIATVPHRTMVRCHRRTERRIRDILAGRGLPHDVEVVDL